MISIIALVLQVFISLVSAPVNEPVVIPPMPNYAPERFSPEDEYEFKGYWWDAYSDYENEFTALFNGYETKWSKNNRLMIRRGNSGPYTFAKKG